MQQAGIAELGPYVLAYKGWKLRVYRALWSQVQRYWQAERWIRVTDTQDAQVFLQLNALGTDEWGRPAIVNAVGSLDVDIILDEGPDSINMLADTFDALRALIGSGHSVPPDILLELAPGIDNATRRRLLERLRAPDPMAGPAQQMAMAKETAMLEGMQANIESMRANTESTEVKTAKEMAEAMGQTPEA